MKYPRKLGPMIRFLSIATFALVPALGEAQENPDACPQMFSASDFFSANAKGEAAFADLDADGLEAAYLESKQVLFCMQGEIQGMMAASFHRMAGMQAFVAGDRERVLQEFSRARLLHQGYEIPDSVAPPGHPLKVLYQEAKTMGEGELQRGVPPEGGWLVVDGVRNGARPVAADVFVQVYTLDGDRQATVFVAAGESMPAWGVEGSFSKKGLRTPAIVATGVSALATGVFFGLSWKNRLLFDGDVASTPCTLGAEQCLDQYKDRTNAMVWSSVGAGALTLGFGGLTVYTW